MYFGIYDVTSGNLDGYEAVQPLNGGDATLWGAEFSFNQQLTILPGALSGLGVYANYTWTDSDAGIIGRGDGNRLPGQAQHTSNPALSYEKSGFSGRLAWDYFGDHVDEVGEDASEDRIHAAATGTMLRRVGGPGAGLGAFQYPNGIAVADDLLLVVERDNHRVQAMALPGFRPLGSFREDVLLRPYGIAFFRDGAGVLQVYVTDDYGNEVDPPEGEDPSGDLTRRVRHFALDTRDGGFTARLAGTFGEASGPGALHVVESIQVDEAQGILLVADEHRFEMEVYDLQGAYLDRTLGTGPYRFGDPEGIMLYRCGAEEG